MYSDHGRLKGQLIKDGDSNAGTEICMSDDDIPLSEEWNKFLEERKWKITTITNNCESRVKDHTDNST